MLRPLPPFRSAAWSDGGPTSRCGARARRDFSNFRELVQERAHFHVRVDAQFELAAVRGAARDRHFDPQISFMREADLERRRLGDDRAIGVDAS